MEDNAENALTVEVDEDVDDTNSFVESELEALQSIYINELEIKHDEKKSTCVLIDLHPATADKQDEQYVKMTLKFTLNEEYPHAIPQISIHNPRGLSEEKINSTYQDLLSIAENKIGSSMLFEIIEAAKEHLTAENRPCEECAICLYGFSESDVFTKTDCYHYFHSHCLARYAKDTVELEVDNTEEEEAKKLLCPMCRVPIQFSGTAESFPPPAAAEEDVVIGDEILEIQKQMADLYQKQLEKGGIIDVEAEKNKYLLEISNVPTVSNAPEKSEVVDEAVASEIAEETSSVSLQNDKNQTTREVKEPRNSNVKSDDKSRPKNRGRQNQNYQNNYPRNNRRYRPHDDYRYDDYDDDGYAPGDFEVDARPKYSNSRDSYRRDGPRMRRGNRDGFNRGNSRYPRKNNGPYNPNQRQRTPRDSRESDDNHQDESTLSDSSPIKEVSPLDEDTKETHPPESSSDSYKSRGNYDRRGKNQGRFQRGARRGRGGNPARNDSYRGNRPFRDSRDRNYSGRYQEDSRPRGSDHEGSSLPDEAGKCTDSHPHKETDRSNEGGDNAVDCVADSANLGESSDNQASPRLEQDECSNREESDVHSKRNDMHRPHNEERRFQRPRNNYDDRRYQRYDDNPRRSNRDGGYDSYQDRRGYQHSYNDRRGGRGGRGNGGFPRGGGQRRNQDGKFHQGERNSYRQGKFDERQPSGSSHNASEKPQRSVAPDAVNGSKGSEKSAVPFDPSQKGLRPPPGFHNPNKKVVYGQESFNAPPGFPRR